MELVAVAPLQKSPQGEHDDFLPLADVVRRRACAVFRGFNDGEKEELLAEAIAAAFKSFVSLKASGKNPVRDFPGAMATFAVLRAQCGRRVGSKTTSKEVLAFRAQKKHGFKVHTLPLPSCRSLAVPSPKHRGLDARWAACFCDNTRTPVPDQVAFRIDFAAFMMTLSGRDRALAEFLAQGHAAKDAAAKFRLSTPRVSQLRQAWYQQWLAFQGELAGTLAARSHLATEV